MENKFLVFADPEGNAQPVQEYHYELVKAEPMTFSIQEVTEGDFLNLTKHGYKLKNGVAVAPKIQEKEAEEEAPVYDSTIEKMIKLEEENAALQKAVEELLHDYALASLSDNKKLMKQLKEDYKELISASTEEDNEEIEEVE